MANKIYKTQFKNGYHYLVGYVPYTVNGIKKHKEVTYRVINHNKITNAEKKAFDEKVKHTELDIANKANSKDYFNTIFMEHFNVFVKHEGKAPSRAKILERFENRIKPYFDGIKIVDIDSFLVQKFLNELLRDKDLKASYVRHIFFDIKRVFTQLHIDGKIVRNPMISLKAPKIEKERPTAPSYEQLQKIKERVNNSKINPTFRLAINIIINEGLRVSECCGLCLDVIDLIKKEIEINRTVTDFKGKFFLSDRTKSYESQRFLRVTDDTINIIQEFLKNNILKPYKENDKIYLIQQNDGTPITPKYIANCYYKVVKAMIKKGELPTGTRTGIHKVRTTITTHYKQLGLDSERIAMFLGHTPEINRGNYTGKIIVSIH